MAKLRTERGFRIFLAAFLDHDKNAVSMVESSLAFEGPHCRIYVNGTCAHLGVADAKRVRDALTTFLREAKRGQLTELMEEKHGEMV